MRLFAAADIPGAVRAPLAVWGAACAGEIAGLRAIPAERLHLTLVFLGSRDDEEAPVIGELVTACADGPVEVSLGEPLWLSPRRPHVTVARVRRGAGVRPGDVALPRVPSPSFALEALTLYRSHPGPAPRYEALARTSLE